jgi:flagellar biosynthesis/type III secretory pathway chaperone
MNNTEGLIKQLITIIAEELQTHDKLVETARNMNTAIKKKEVREVQHLTQTYDALAGRIEELEELRLKSCDDYAAALTGKQQHMTLVNVIATVTDEQLKNELGSLRANIKDRITALTRLNTSNQILLEASLAMIAKNFELMLSARAKFKGYGHGGQMDSRNISRNIVNKIA